MKKYLVIASCVFLASCDLDIPKTEYSRELQEPATVVDIAYMPANHGSDVAIGVTMNLDVTVTPVSVKIPAKYAVVFQCEHGRFIIEGSKKKHKDLWSKMKRGDKVIVHYKEVYRVTKKERKLVDFDFLDATVDQLNN